MLLVPVDWLDSLGDFVTFEELHSSAKITFSLSVFHVGPFQIVDTNN